MEMKIVFPGGKRVDAIYQDFIIKTDQPPSSGGDGFYPEPFDLFLASIGTCAGIYVLSFCQHHSLPTDQIKLIMRTERNKNTRMVEKISIEILLPPQFPEKYHQAVVRAAQACTVKKHLVNPPSFEVYTNHL